MQEVPKWLRELIVVVIVVLLIRAFLLQAYNIPSGSMKPTLLVGDFILVNKVVYRLSEPQRGDIVVFKWPVNPQIDFIKRIIGMPGDTLEIKGERVFINGQELPLRFVGEILDEGKPKLIYEETLPNGVKYKIALDPFIQRGHVRYGKIHKECSVVVEDEKKDSEEASEETENILKIPEGCYFVMGDNRDNSEDSRYWGLLPRENIVGKAFVVYFSGDIPPLDSTDVSILTGFKQLFLALLNPRFERIGRPFIW